MPSGCPLHSGEPGGFIVVIDQFDHGLCGAAVFYSFGDDANDADVAIILHANLRLEKGMEDVPRHNCAAIYLHRLEFEQSQVRKRFQLRECSGIAQHFKLVGLHLAFKRPRHCGNSAGDQE